MNENKLPMLPKAHLTMTFLHFDRVETSNFTVDKTPLSVDNSIKQGCNASLQRRFEIKQRHQKPLQGDFAAKQVDKDSLKGVFG